MSDPDHKDGDNEGGPERLVCLVGLEQYADGRNYCQIHKAKMVTPLDRYRLLKEASENRKNQTETTHQKDVGPQTF